MRFLKTTVVLAGMVCGFVSCERRSMGVGELAAYKQDLKRVSLLVWYV